MSGSSDRSVPFHCPYCGEGDLWPHEVTDTDGTVSSPHGTWECRGCLRAFKLTGLGIVHRPHNEGAVR